MRGRVGESQLEMGRYERPQVEELPVNVAHHDGRCRRCNAHNVGLSPQHGNGLYQETTHLVLSEQLLGFKTRRHFARRARGKAGASLMDGAVLVAERLHLRPSHRGQSSAVPHGRRLRLRISRTRSLNSLEVRVEQVICFVIIHVAVAVAVAATPVMSVKRARQPPCTSGTGPCCGTTFQ